MSDGFAYFCCDERRRDELRRLSAEGKTTLNGIDFLEVVDRAAPTPAERQRTLRVHFVVQPVDEALKSRVRAANVRITGGERVRDVRIEGDPAFVDDDVPGESYLQVRVNTPGDYSTYTLHLVEAEGGGPLAGLDPLLAAVDFSFKVECPGDFDCRDERVCPPSRPDEPEIDYLAKDYASFRQLLLDRMALLLPDWKERNPADVGIALIELLAYVGDQLSYEQDAIATEAYLGTARRRESVRRHARLLDYALHDGCNARVWVQVGVEGAAPADGIPLPARTPLLTSVPGAPMVLAPDGNALADALGRGPEVFETLHDARLFPEHNRIFFYTFGERECCLPAGATRATLAGDWPRLAKGDVLVFEEALGPRTGAPGDADPGHRHAVRLTEVRRPLADPLLAAPVTEIAWDAADALPFPLCLSATTDVEHASRYVENVSVARGNIVLADHGRTIPEEALDPPPAPRRRPVVAAGGDRCAAPADQIVTPRYRPRLQRQPLTQAARTGPVGRVGRRQQRLAFDPGAPAADAFVWEMRAVLPQAELRDTRNNVRWTPRRDLLGSDAFAPEFVAEVDEAGRATLRFGDDRYGQRPAPATAFRATYRVGNGARGNIGADALAHIVFDDARIVSVRNPLPARGGRDPEPLEEARQNAPAAFRTQERAVTPEDYAAVAQRHAEVQRAEATIRWTGSWHTIFLTVDRLGGRPVDAAFEQRLRRHLERFRMAGHDIEIDGPRFVPLEIEIFACVQPGYFRADVEAALRDALGSRTLPDGRRGLFHPDNFTFGQPVHPSPVIAAAQSVAGVRWVELRRFRRLGGADVGSSIPIGRLEIARLDNDPSFPERGVLRLSLEGGR